uniref:Uncharacterized protein n=1 Tax=Anopheles quadriannulatus TaxID=34691 RepID=A0A182XQ58_ANOQN
MIHGPYWKVIYVHLVFLKARYKMTTMSCTSC